ncbi:MAG: NAD+ synthase [Acidimicrobiales bacterium]|nr:NAD+ synthase [Acidimicrobiales bacterium]
MARIRVALCQVNTVVGDLDGNVERVVAALAEAESAGADVAVFPEMTLTGYPVEDLVLKPGFVADSVAALEKLTQRTGDCALVVGFADAGPTNALAVCAGGRIHGTYHKRELPTYAVFDEGRTFRPGDEPMQLYAIRGVRVGVSICEDIWVEGGPVHQLGAGGAELILNINGSPYHRGKMTEREALLRDRAAAAGCPIVYVNLVGGQDELVFDGGSMVVDPAGNVVARAAQFAEQVLVVDLEVPERPPGLADFPVLDLPAGPARERSDARPPVVTPLLDPLAELYEALVLATRDYVGKSGFAEVAIGLSGGVDSSLVAAVAADALGAERVHGVLMPSRYSSDHSVADAVALAERLGIDHRTVPIEPAHAALLGMLAPSFEGRDPDLTEENLQSRIRGVVLMALANKLGWLVLTTGNKSETAVGYSTLYGDTAGAYAVIKDVYKLGVYELCRHRNALALARGEDPPIPESVLVKPPSAELRPDQRDDQSLPPYEVLDPLLEAYIEGDATATGLEAQGFPADLVRRVVRLVDLSEYKRRQSPLGPRVTRKAFGRDRRIPIVNRYRG